MAQNPKITTGPNDRPRNETIAQTGAGIPDDSARPVEASEASIARVKEQLTSFAGKEARGNPEAVPAGSPGAGENVCRRCTGTGKVEGGRCPDCGGLGKVTTPIGGG